VELIHHLLNSQTRSQTNHLLSLVQLQEALALLPSPYLLSPSKLFHTQSASTQSHQSPTLPLLSQALTQTLRMVTNLKFAWHHHTSMLAAVSHLPSAQSAATFVLDTPPTACQSASPQPCSTNPTTTLCAPTPQIALDSNPQSANHIVTHMSTPTMTLVPMVSLKSALSLEAVAILSMVSAQQLYARASASPMCLTSLRLKPLASTTARQTPLCALPLTLVMTLTKPFAPESAQTISTLTPNSSKEMLPERTSTSAQSKETLVRLLPQFQPALTCALATTTPSKTPLLPLALSMVTLVMERLQPLALHIS